jgi:chromosome segregation ATPase
MEDLDDEEQIEEIRDEARKLVEKEEALEEEKEELEEELRVADDDDDEMKEHPACSEPRVQHHKC